jgi:hypothetical protein
VVTRHILTDRQRTRTHLLLLWLPFIVHFEKMLTLVWATTIMADLGTELYIFRQFVPHCLGWKLWEVTTSRRGSW